jgi:hypothetical protein
VREMQSRSKVETIMGADEDALGRATGDVRRYAGTIYQLVVLPPRSYTWLIWGSGRPSDNEVEMGWVCAGGV